MYFKISLAIIFLEFTGLADSDALVLASEHKELAVTFFDGGEGSDCPAVALERGDFLEVEVGIQGIRDIESPHVYCSVLASRVELVLSHVGIDDVHLLLVGILFREVLELQEIVLVGLCPPALQRPVAGG